MKDLLTIILAAGQGTRMKSDLIKVLHHLGGKPMIQHVIDNVKKLSDKIVIVVGYQADQVKDTINDDSITFIEQKEQLGTGHAVLQANSLIAKHHGPVLILYGDIPLLTEDTLNLLVEKQRQSQIAATVLTASFDDPGGYGRIVRGSQQQLIKIVEDNDADQTEKEIKEINSGVYCFDSNYLKEALQNLDNDNAQAEYYLTDTISYLNRNEHKVIPILIPDSEEITGINDRVNLARAEKILRRRINNYHMENGVTIIDPETTYIDSQVEIEQDTIIYPFTYIEKNSMIGKNTTIGAHCRIRDCRIGNNVEIMDHCIIFTSQIANNTTVGPFAYIRPGTVVNQGAKVGDFVELKNAVIGQNTKVPHLSYIGDAEIGQGTNIGAGTIFANYDGKEKHKTTVGNSAFIGSNTTLIAPVKVADGGKTGAGSVVTRDVPTGQTVVGVPARIMQKKPEGGSKSN